MARQPATPTIVYDNVERKNSLVIVHKNSCHYCPISLTNMFCSCPPKFTVHLTPKKVVKVSIIHLLRWMLEEVRDEICHHVGSKGGSNGLGDGWCCNSRHIFKDTVTLEKIVLRLEEKIYF